MMQVENTVLSGKGENADSGSRGLHMMLIQALDQNGVHVEVSTKSPLTISTETLLHQGFDRC